MYKYYSILFSLYYIFSFVISLACIPNEVIYLYSVHYLPRVSSLTDRQQMLISQT